MENADFRESFRENRDFSFKGGAVWINTAPTLKLKLKG
jgi:hypothetical protein